ncbi:MAG: ABC transporter permease [Candidatus Lindowbacteria bacterium]|nr:ABC transporter permease [Candidatus Lindowbacteria bacterium]
MIAAFFRDIIVHRELLGSFVARDLTSKYRGTFIGFFWNVINPLVMLALYTFIFSVVLKVKFGTEGTTGNFALYLFCGMVPWLAFSDSLNRGTSIIVAHHNLVKKTVFPLEILPCYAVISGVVTECVGLGILLVAAIAAARGASMSLVILPLLIILQLLFTLGLAFFFSSMCVFFRDVMYFVGMMTTIWMFLTPIMYPETLFPERARFLLWLNPMAVLVGMFRDSVLEGNIPALWKVGAFAAWAFAAFAGGLFFFRKTKWEFADVI